MAKRTITLQSTYKQVKDKEDKAKDNMLVYQDADSDDDEDEDGED
jgi:hypothetical protein